MAEPQTTPRFKHAKTLALYAVAIFTFFIILVFLSYLAQRQRELNELQANSAELQADFAAVAMERINELQQESRQLIEQDASSYETMLNMNERLLLIQSELNNLLGSQKELLDRLVAAEAENAALHDALAVLEQQLAAYEAEKAPPDGEELP